MAYYILCNFAVDKGSVLGVAFGGLLYCLPTGFNLFWIIYPVSALMFCKINCWELYLFELDSE